MDITFDSDMYVDLIDFMGSDQRVVQAAQVSTKGAESVNSEAKEGLIRYLVNNRHASPTEHSVFTFLITAPIFVAREAHRHRIASLNEESGRYKELSPHFYVPGPDRKLQQVGKTGDYKFTEGTEEQKEAVRTHVSEASEDAWDRYQEKKFIFRSIFILSPPLPESNTISADFICLPALCPILHFPKRLFLC